MSLLVILVFLAFLFIDERKPSRTAACTCERCGKVTSHCKIYRFCPDCAGYGWGA